MIEPTTPTTLRVKYSSYPAFLLASDEGVPLGPSSVILRHRHLRQQQRVIQRGVIPHEGPGARATRGLVISDPGQYRLRNISPSNENTSAPQPSTSTNGSQQTIDVTEETPTSTSSSTPSSSSNVSIPPFPGAFPRPERAATPPRVPTSATPPKVPVSGARTAQRVLPPSDQSFSLSALPEAQTITTSIGPLLITRTSRSLRSRKMDKNLRGEKTVWFASSSEQMLDVPPSISLARPGDLYVHSTENSTKQVWLLDASTGWTSVELLHPHPYLHDYVLNFCNNGEPSWVTRETIRTYKGRILKAARDQGKSPSL